MILSSNPMKRLKTKNADHNEDSSTGDSSKDSSSFLGLWEGLSPEILSLIFVRIQQDELVKIVPFVCQPWREVVAGPYCWSDIDIEQWCRRCNDSSKIDSVVRKLIRRSRGHFHRLSVYKLSNFGFTFVANCAEHLKALQIPMSGITDKTVEKYVTSFAKLTFLDISNCLQITCKGLEILGNNCKSLTSLRRNMPPPEWEEDGKLPAAKINDGEAMVIANTMTSLCQLELAYGRFGDLGLEALVTKCKNLTHLDILGSVCVRLDGDLLDKCERLMVFRGPWDHYDAFSDNDGDDNEAAAGSSDSDSNQ
ncbi:F-box protein FBW2-like [Papaver somniferum]|uniref:F-box protein FBW2-like n=1 Tax=Papaver somniferum TaxID=3469 RepID=UPI000E6FF147|nr:F-box protein FBW2-like [Papaver somniferum]